MLELNCGVNNLFNSYQKDLMKAPTATPLTYLWLKMFAPFLLALKSIHLNSSISWRKNTIFVVALSEHKFGGSCHH